MKRLRRIVGAWPVLALALLTGIWSGCETTKEFPPNAGTGYDDRGRPGDRINILFTEPGLPSNWEQRIGENGMISLPLGRSVEAAGKTKSEMEEAIRKVYVPGLYHRMTVVVELEDRYYFVKGEVKTPGQLRYTGSITILKAITAAGDYTQFADRGHVRLVRNDETYRVNHENFDLPVHPGDTIIVDRRL